MRPKPTIGAVVTLSACGALVLASWFTRPWWPANEPQDFEDCSAQTSALSPDERKALVADCDKRFMGRRKMGGGYTYYDFLQDRHFDIAGPNPTPNELKFFDEQYTSYLGAQRRDAIAVELAKRDSQLTPMAGMPIDQVPSQNKASRPGPPLQIAPLTNVPLPIARSSVITSKDNCEDKSVSCGWSKFSAGVREFFQSNARMGHQ